MKKYIKTKTKELELMLQNQTLSKRTKTKMALTWMLTSVAAFQLPAYADTSSSGFDFVKAFLAWIFFIAGFILLAAGIVVLAQGVFGESSGGNRNTGIGLIIGAFSCFAAGAIFAFLPAMPQYKG
jgi:cytochrome b subunit of formate dehydrogenase